MAGTPGGEGAAPDPAGGAAAGGGPGAAARPMHGWTPAAERLFADVVGFVAFRMRMDPPPLDRSWTPDELVARAGSTVTPEGLGGAAALALFGEVLARANVSTDHPRSLAFIPNAPTEAASLFDLVVGASSIFGGSWLSGSGAVYAENQALRWIADLLGYPPGAGGVFTPGGTQGTLAALVAARHAARLRRSEAGLGEPGRWVVVASDEAHSSVRHVAEVMDVDVLSVPVGDAPEPGRLTGAAAAAALDAAGLGGGAPGGAGPGGPGPGGPGAGGRVPFAVCAVAGTTNYGMVDDVASLADLAGERGLWLHVDGAYGGGGLAAPSVRGLFAGVERSDSFIVDPHKWLFAPYDACALLYRRPEVARAAHTQRAPYLGALTGHDEWNPADYAVHLSRRARGLPFWFSLATHGTDAYAAAVERTLAVARHAEARVAAEPLLELVRPRQLSVVVVRRVGWDADDYAAWSHALLEAGTAFVTPTRHVPPGAPPGDPGEPVTRLAVVNPRTTEADVDVVLDSLVRG